MQKLATSESKHVRFALSIAQVVEQCGLCRTLVYGEIRAGRLKARKCGRRTIILEHDLKAFLSALPFAAAQADVRFGGIQSERSHQSQSRYRVDPFSRAHGFRMTRQVSIVAAEQPELGTNHGAAQQESAGRAVQKIPLSALVATSDSALNEKDLTLLVESLRCIGQTNPILVVRQADGTFRIISGHHRAHAAGVLNWQAIDALVLKASEQGLELVSIAENHHRCPTTVLQRALSTARWCQLSVKEAQNGQPLGGKQPHDLGISKAVLSLGFKRTEVGRLLRIARLTTAAATAAIELQLDDHQAALEKAAKCKTESEQLANLYETAIKRKSSRTKSSTDVVEHLEIGEPPSASLLPSVKS